MSWVAGSFVDYQKAREGLLTYLGFAQGAEPFPGFMGEIAHITSPNQKTQIFIDTPLGKGTGIFFGFLWQMRKKGFHVQKVQEWMEVSPVHSQYYQLTIQQKQQLENQIKSALASSHSAISDYELMAHDLRRYREYMNYFEGLEKAKKEKNEEEIKKNNQTLKSIFIDQVDVHTGEGVALKLIASRWPTIIVDFMKISDDDVDPPKIASKYGFSEAEGVVLATKNKIYLQWKVLFKETVTGRYQHLVELVESRKRSIDEYRNMVKPYITRYKMIREFGETEEGRGLLRSISWTRPSAQAISMDSAEYWMWRPFWPPEIHRPSLQNFDTKVSVLDLNIPEEMKAAIKDEWSVGNKKIPKEVDTFPTGIEPLDKWVWYLKDAMVSWYRDKFKYRSILTLEDVFDARKNLSDQFSEYGRWDWLPSPYFSSLELPVMRIVSRMPDGTESETLLLGSYPDRPLTTTFDTQNVILLRFLELKLIEKETERYLTDMIGETVQGQGLKSFIEEKYPNIYAGGKSPAKTGPPKILSEKEAKEKLTQGFMKNIKFVRPGPYDALFMERVAAMMLKEIGQSTYAYVSKYFKAAAGVP